MLEYLEINIFFPVNVPLQTGKCTPMDACTLGWEPLIYQFQPKARKPEPK